MSAAQQTQAEKLNALYKEYGLVKEDVFIHKTYGFKIIGRYGMDKIVGKANLNVQYELLKYEHEYREVTKKKKNGETYKVSEPQFFVVVKATAEKDGKKVETYGEVNPMNTNVAYPVAVAEKRAMSRAVLKLTGFYELGVFSEDESPDFKRSKHEQNG